MPVHWATFDLGFDLGFHRRAAPVLRLRAAAAQAGVPLVLPLPGGRTDPLSPPDVQDWWSPIA